MFRLWTEELIHLAQEMILALAPSLFPLSLFPPFLTHFLKENKPTTPFLAAIGCLHSNIR